VGTLSEGLTELGRQRLDRERSAYIGALTSNVEALAESKALCDERARKVRASIEKHGLDHPQTRVAFREFKDAEAEFEAAIDRYDADRQAFEPTRETLREYRRVLGPHRHRRGRAARRRTNTRRRGSRRSSNASRAGPGDDGDASDSDDDQLAPAGDGGRFCRARGPPPFRRD
jgi:hypothetical protein